MENPTSLTTQNPEPRRLSGACSDERPSRSPWRSEAPPTGVLTGVLGELAFYYGACWLYHRSTPPRQKKMR